MVGDLHVTPGLMGVEKHEQVGRVVALVFAIVPLGLAGRGGDRLAHLSDQLGEAFIEAYHGALWICFFRVEIKHILHAGDIIAIHLGDAPHGFLPRLQLVFGQASAYRLARQVLVLCQPDDLVGKQVQRPARASIRRGGARGGDQQGLLAAGQLPRGAGALHLGKGKLKIALYEAAFGAIDGGTTDAERGCDLVIGNAGIGRQQDLGTLELARRVLSAA